MDKQLIHEKLIQAQSILDELDIDLWLTYVRETFMHSDPALELILNANVTWQSAFLVARQGRPTAIVGHFDGPGIQALDAYDVITYHEGIGLELRTVLRRIDPDTIAINYSEGDVAADGLTVGMHRNLLRHLHETPYGERLMSAEKLIAALRGRKSQAEIERVRATVARTEELFDKVEAFVRPGMTQRQIAEFVHERIDDAGLGYAWDWQYNPIVTCGPDSPAGHTPPGDVPLERGHLLHMDLGVRQNHYCSDLQRMWYVLDEGETEAPADVQRAFDVVRGAIEAGREALRPGVPGWQVDQVARAYIIAHGYPEYMHAFGHLLGRSAHDGATVLGPLWERYRGIAELPVEAGNIFTLELHVPVAGRGIMSLEEDVVVREAGVEYLAEPQTELRYIEP